VDQSAADSMSANLNLVPIMKLPQYVTRKVGGSWAVVGRGCGCWSVGAAAGGVQGGWFLTV